MGDERHDTRGDGPDPEEQDRFSENPQPGGASPGDAGPGTVPAEDAGEDHRRR